MPREPRNKSVVRRGPNPGQGRDGLVTPIYPSVVYRSPGPDALDAQYDAHEGYTYAREGHPNADALAAKIDWLEGAEGGLITGSGMAALSAILLAEAGQGRHIIAGDQLYGRSLRMLKQDAPRLGLDVTFVDTTDADNVADALRADTALVLVEVVSNPTLRIADIGGISALIADHPAALVVDNTFTTPRAFRPFDHGADIVLSSVTKLLAGHSDVTLGYVAARDPAVRTRIEDAIVTWGLTPSPFDCWLAERGLHSFALRFDAASRNAAELADFLGSDERVARVLYPGRDDHPDHARAEALLGGAWGNMVSFEIPGGRAAANAMVSALPDIAFAPTLGDIGTTLSHPPSSSHRGLTADERSEMGISEGFFRVSVGVEDIDILRDEIDTALDAAGAFAD